MTNIVLEICSNPSGKINGIGGLAVGQGQWLFVGQDKRFGVGQVRIMHFLPVFIPSCLLRLHKNLEIFRSFAATSNQYFSSLNIFDFAPGVS